ncbi:glutamine synthetase III [Ereboglobus luteus]|uniref:Glutamine synthetase type III n=1 Tax=Ereboglobus luteus TaxID=1796921 RepID=A0A2U8E4E9_9BACT|nr:glutamine synthetase III [Ereboglobus luteus]AWI09402.1 glutamine synthetase type III [Ereboglobus luteus]
MSVSPARLSAISAANNYRVTATVAFNESHTAELFGRNVFTDELMQARLPKAIYKSLRKTIETVSKLEPATADAVATAIKDWALERGATHYAHVFQPLTGLTAEKHDSFLEPDGKDGAIAEFSGKQLILGESDASALPSGGIRATFEARGYTAWDVTSPCYLLENPNGATLCIPTVFVSWTGESLDLKTPILRSAEALDEQARRILKLFGHTDVPLVTPTAGPEQEYFLIDRNFFLARPDLMTAGRTLFGARPPKGQEFADQYYGVIPERVLAYMHECEAELYKLGVPIKTRHNEVAPSQYEIAPVYENANVAADHQQLTMIVLKRVARKYGFECILHEKPFSGVNGSGKHLNWSLGNSVQGNLLDPGATPHENMQFLVFCAAIIRAVHRHGGLLRALVGSASNDQRLGANEAPPAIISIFLGAQLSDVFEQLKKGRACSSKKAGTIQLGVDSLPVLQRDTGDRNRTSPFAFTGNKFEFRAVGSNQSIGAPLAALNTIVAGSLNRIADQLEKGVADGKKLEDAVSEVLTQIARENGAVIFNGNGYSPEWHREAERLGLLNLKTTPDAAVWMVAPDTVECFERMKVLTKRELESRREIALEQYCKALNVETRIVIEMVSTKYIPTAIRYQTELARNINEIKAVGAVPDTRLFERVSTLIAGLQNELDKLTGMRGKQATLPDLLAEARHYCHEVLPQLNAIRQAVDALETVCPDDTWPVPTYEEMLFIK